MTLSPENARIRAALARAKAIRTELARRDPNVFVQTVLRDEETGQRVKQAPYHSDWQTMISDHKRLVIWSHVEAGKTQQIGVGRALWELGRDTSLRIVICHNTALQAAKVVRSIGHYIENNEDVKTIFPHLKPGKTWKRDTLIVERDSAAKDPSVQACGLHGSILGARIDLLIIDDMLDFESTHTDYMRKDTIRWIDSTLLGRMTRRGRVVIIGNAWHREDAMHVLSRRGPWTGKKYPVRGSEGSNWPERWPLERIEERQAELGPFEFQRQMLCEARADGQSRFRQEDIDSCIALGKGRKLGDRSDLGPNDLIIAGVDLGVRRDLSSIFVVSVGKGGKKCVREVQSGNWPAKIILEKIEETHRKWGAQIICENNAAQDYIVQFLKEKGVPVRPFTTGKNKAHPLYGLESIAAELGRDEWIIPSNEDGTLHPEIKAWTEEMLFYDPKGHAGDRLMASWFAREGLRRYSHSRVACAGDDDMSSGDNVIDFAERTGHHNVSGGAYRDPVWDTIDLGG